MRRVLPPCVVQELSQTFHPPAATGPTHRTPGTRGIASTTVLHPSKLVHPVSEMMRTKNEGSETERNVPK